jgi:riboflavin synthase
MFTGLIEAIGTVSDVAPSAAGSRILVQTALGAELVPGDSLAVNGVCLTVVTRDAGSAAMDVSPQTARVTTLGSIHAGSLLNLERSLSAGARLGGHFVQGHVDATGVVEAVAQQGDSWWLTFTYPPALGPYIVSRGSIAVDGISLTIADLDESSFSVQIVPFTWEHTNLHGLSVGAAVNLESDILGKYVVRALGFRGIGEGVAPPERD